MLDPLLLMAIMLVIVPIAGFFCLFLPIYLGMVTSLHLIYQPEDQAAHPVSGMMYDVGQIVDSYRALFNHWQLYGDSLNFMDFTMPLFAPPIVGALIGIGMLYYFIQYCINIFRV